jgi:acetyl/propionyl-CoA carboxylase alpha subunit
MATPSEAPVRPTYTEGSKGELELVHRPATAIEMRLQLPPGGQVSCRHAFAAYLGVPGAGLVDLLTLPQGLTGQRLVALRYIIANGAAWLTHFAWQNPLRAALTPHLEAEGLSGALLESRVEEALTRIRELVVAIDGLRSEVGSRPAPDDGWVAGVLEPSSELCQFPEGVGPEGVGVLRVLVTLDAFPELRQRCREALRQKAVHLYARAPRALDLLYLATTELTRYPATTVSAGELKYVLVADKGEMGVRAVREAAALGKIPVALYSLKDDANSLQLRLAESFGGFGIGLEGAFRESYANYAQMSERVVAAFQERFSDAWDEELRRAALYPGYGPLAENSAAIRHFRRHGIVFIGPMQDVVENIGDKRNFRRLAQSLDATAVTPGLVIDSSEPEVILNLVREGLTRGDFALPGRIKAANGGGGRGQAIVSTAADLPAAVNKVLGEIQTYGWDPGVMFEQNIFETIHLEVQVLRDRYGNTRHFGMRDCSEQRASQKIQEEAPPALLTAQPELRARIERTAVEIIDSVGYVGAATVELMYKEGRFYFLETNTRIQVEHPVTEECHCIRREHGQEPLNLVQLQMRVAEGMPLDFEQEQIVPTHVAREFRINAESWNPKLKDSRDGQRGLFVPNGGTFDVIAVPTGAEVLEALGGGDFGGEGRIVDLKVRFDSGFEPGDTLVNKDPTFGKLIVALRAEGASQPYELLRKASLEVLRRVRIEGRQVLPTGKVLEDTPFRTNVADHLRILEEPVLVRHSQGDETGRHVNWVLAAFRATLETGEGKA